MKPETMTFAISRKFYRPLSTLLAWMCVLSSLASCSRSEDTSPTILPTRVFGVVGRMPGGFVYPRAIDADSNRRCVYVIDRSGRVQRFGFDGEPQFVWELALTNDGYPTGISVADDGRVFIANTHEHEVKVVDPDGNVLDRVGGYGTGPGEFMFVSDVAFGPEGRVYVCEYNGNDRIQVFDAELNYLFEFGSFGSEPGQFNRPQSMAFDPQGRELFVADAVNNRIQVFDPDGNLKRTFGTTGTDPGEFRYPYGVLVLPDGRVLVTEFGNSRLQILSAEGRSLRVMGAPGEVEGQFLAPWSAAWADGILFVLDSRNSRVQVFELPG